MTHDRVVKVFYGLLFDWFGKFFTPHCKKKKYKYCIQLLLLLLSLLSSSSSLSLCKPQLIHGRDLINEKKKSQEKLQVKSIVDSNPDNKKKV